jgi:methyl-accepting chemotaxis protein
MNTNEAIAKHAQWTFKFRTAIHEGQQLDVNAIARDNQCDFGKWLHGEGRSLYGDSPVHARCVADHAAFHREAAKVAAAVNARQKDRIESMLGPGTPYHDASKKVCTTIVELGNVLKR